MSDTVWIALIAAVAIVAVIFIFRDRLKEFGLVVTPNSFKARLKGQETKTASQDRTSPVSAAKTSPVQNVVGDNVQAGGGPNEIEVGARSAVERNKQFSLSSNSLKVGVGSTPEYPPDEPGPAPGKRSDRRKGS
jgi:hypothetical protein